MDGAVDGHDDRTLLQARAVKRKNIVRSGRAAAGATAAHRTRRVAAHSRAAGPGQRTRAQLIEVAGQVFAEQGFDGATGQGICRRAGFNSAAIVYHFGGMAGLHRAVLEEAQRRLVTTEALAAAVKAERNPRRQLEAFLGLIVRALTSPVSQSWAGRLFSREWVTPLNGLRTHARPSARRQIQGAEIHRQRLDRAPSRSSAGRARLHQRDGALRAAAIGQSAQVAAAVAPFGYHARVRTADHATSG